MKPTDRPAVPSPAVPAAEAPACPPEPAASPRGPGRELRALRTVWQREMIRFLRDRTQLVAGLVQPALYLFVLGSGLSAVVPGTTGSADYRTFLFPGVLVMTVQAPALFAGISIVWDREFGFLREMLVAPVRRGSLLLGKCLGGATVATLQGTALLGLAWSVHVPCRPGLLATLFGEMLLIALAMTSLSALIAVSIARLQTFQAVLSFALMPMTFLSGAMFPLSGLPRWLSAVTLLDPLRYAVDPPQRAVGGALPGHGRTGWTAWQPPVALELGLIGVTVLAALALGTRRFSRIP